MKVTVEIFRTLLPHLIEFHSLQKLLYVKHESAQKALLSMVSEYSWQISLRQFKSKELRIANPQNPIAPVVEVRFKPTLTLKKRHFRTQIPHLFGREFLCLKVSLNNYINQLNLVT